MLSKSQIERMLERDPTRLVDIVHHWMLPPAELTFAAEALGQCPSIEAAWALNRALEHESPLVREGAVYGLSHHFDKPGTRDRLRAVLKRETSPGVAMALREVLDGD
jgi:hypothetical protein